MYSTQRQYFDLDMDSTFTFQADSSLTLLILQTIILLIDSILTQLLPVLFWTSSMLIDVWTVFPDSILTQFENKFFIFHLADNTESEN